MQSMHSKTVLIRPPTEFCTQKNINSTLKIEILCPENLILHSKLMVLQTDCPELCAQKREILGSEIEIPDSENGKFPHYHEKLAFP